jgi:hypothetical protein
MIVVYPNFVVGRENVLDGVTKALVNAFVVLPASRLVLCVGRKIVEQGPEGRVAKTQVKPLHIFFAEKYRMG